MTKGKVVQIGILLSLLGLISFKLFSLIGVDNFTTNTFSSCILFLIVITWVSSYVFRVINGKMTFMEQRKRYRKDYEKVVNDKLEAKFNALSKEEQEKLMEDLEKNP
ncbi:DUF3007 family protein [Prochlorococcus marinus XMU1419]|uniref:DUF3007 family protein n=1 Tax=Prochlorococcus marinus TaxID=1219 RepID=UPI001ADBA5FD|nr:DUF3007 family protein [Prochlorococcus marinus]MBO8233481.1 DUF3007 family protein [Prochlorococcus marinus XMU1419]MBW3076961.1 DUF3007 domain-containing protein [Prochlorococcus marinus str. XMU1419]